MTDNIVNVIECGDWQQFEAHLSALRPIRSGPRSAFGNPGELLFRGQEDADWPLATTLERAAHYPCSCPTYDNLIKGIKGEIEAYTGRSWGWVEESNDHGLPSQIVASHPSQATFPFHKLRNFSYMAYLRHFGFPSPLLDWSRSPFIAAHFACRGNVLDKSFAIHVFDEMPRGFKVQNVQGPQIKAISGVDTDQRRHFLQQSAYTVCLAFDTVWKYVPHRLVAETADGQGDVLTKCVFPATARGGILKMLERMNVNSYSLFGTEEALLATLSSRNFGANL